ncbi:Unknown protein [Striga hermonthica]|uniref:Gag-pol polyprotein n=1 Tax=Striga hermonthica TaxID=68872 RepID=A0A9N7MRT6_STRHE|nr:Unknown protein [Striga hermonthica]
MFRLISMCTTAKDAWDTLQRHCEGSKSVCQTRLRLLAAKFETIRMLENENISSYTAKLMNIANECYSLGEPISNEKLVAKVMRSLPKRFNMMITALDVSKDVTAIIFDDLVGTLKTFEMNLEVQDLEEKSASFGKGKGIALHSVTKDGDNLENLVRDMKENEFDEEGVAHMTRRFTSLLKRKNSQNNSQASRSRMPRPFTPPHSNRSHPIGEKAKLNDGRKFTPKSLETVQCNACKGGCSRHMTGTREFLSNVELYEDTTSVATRISDEQNTVSEAETRSDDDVPDQRKVVRQSNPLSRSFGETKKAAPIGSSLLSFVCRCPKNLVGSFFDDRRETPSVAATRRLPLPGRFSWRPTLHGEDESLPAMLVPTPASRSLLAAHSI